MSSMLVLVLIIIAVSGVIAYVGDLVGRKMGRKRLSLFGLRPRYTAIAISSCVGMIIAALTLTATFLVSEPIRKAFIIPLEQLQADLADARTEVAQTKTALIAARGEVDATSNQLTAEKLRLAATQQQLTASLNKRKDIERQLVHAREEYDAARKNLSTVQANLTARQIDVTNASKNLLVKAGEVEKKNKQLLALDLQIESLQVLASSSFAPPVLSSGQEMLTGLFTTTDSAVARRKQLLAFLTLADQVVHLTCKDLPKNAPGIVFYDELANKQPVSVPMREVVQLLDARIAGMASTADGVILRLSPINNVPVNGQAVVATDTITLLPNRRIFETGSEVAHLDLTVTATSTSAEIFTRLVDDLLRERVSTALRAKEMLMVNRRFDPARPTEVPAPSWSLVSWADLLQAAERAKGMKGAVRVSVRTRNAVECIGPLAVELTVAPAP